MNEIERNPRLIHDLSRRKLEEIVAAGWERLGYRVELTSWTTFLKAHWESNAATDFFTVEVITVRGLITRYVLFTWRIITKNVIIRRCRIGC